MLRSEIAFLTVVKHCCNQHQFSVGDGINDGDLRETDITLSKLVYKLYIRYLVYCSC